MRKPLNITTFFVLGDEFKAGQKHNLVSAKESGKRMVRALRPALKGGAWASAKRHTGKAALAKMKRDVSVGAKKWEKTVGVAEVSNSMGEFEINVTRFWPDWCISIISYDKKSAKNAKRLYRSLFGKGFTLLGDPVAFHFEKPSGFKKKQASLFAHAAVYKDGPMYYIDGDYDPELIKLYQILEYDFRWVISYTKALSKLLRGRRLVAFNKRISKAFDSLITSENFELTKKQIRPVFRAFEKEYGEIVLMLLDIELTLDDVEYYYEQLNEVQYKKSETVGGHIKSRADTIGNVVMGMAEPLLKRYSYLTVLLK